MLYVCVRCYGEGLNENYQFIGLEVLLIPYREICVRFDGRVDLDSCERVCVFLAVVLGVYWRLNMSPQFMTNSSETSIAASPCFKLSSNYLCLYVVSPSVF